jgi:alkane 1-monooxygenase
VAFVLIPILDALLPASTKNIPAEEEAKRSHLLFFDLLLYASAPICFFLTWFYFHRITTTNPGTAELIGMTASMGIVLGSLGINVSHELGHRPNRLSQFFAKAMLLLVFYQHFFIEHNRGHHKLVSTDADPASARKNESLYAFFIRSVIGQYFSAWKLEKQRLSRHNRKTVSLNNAMIRFTIYQLLYIALVVYLFGWRILPFVFAIALIAVILLETINYIEHYGLRRALLPDGKPEMVMPKHSWNSDHEMGRILLFELTRHSDHHYRASRKYQVLRHLDESPQLPTGYPGSMLLAAIPPLWFRVMNKRLPLTYT